MTEGRKGPVTEDRDGRRAGVPPEVDRPPPDGGTGVLAGLRVLDLAGEPLAYAGRMFADLGADVVLVEPPGGGTGRSVPPLVAVATGVPVSAHFAFVAAGKRSIALDASTPGGRDLLDRLVARADVVLVPEDDVALASHGIDVAGLRARHDRLVVASVRPFGGTGPRRSWRGSDLVAWASSGAMFGLGDPDRPPVAPGGGLGHAAAALNAAAGVMVALRARRRTGRGQAVDISAQEAVLSVGMEAGPLLTLEGRQNQSAGGRRAPGHGLYPVKDGMVEIVAFLPNQWQAVAEWVREELGYEEATLDTFGGSLLNRIEYFELLDGWVLELTGRYTKQEFFEEAQRRGIPCGPVNSAGDLLHDPHLRSVGAWADSPHPEAGSIRSPRGPVRFDGVPLSVGAVPSVGQHTDEILAELGHTPEEVAGLRADGVI